MITAARLMCVRLNPVDARHLATRLIQQLTQRGVLDVHAIVWSDQQPFQLECYYAGRTVIRVTVADELLERIESPDAAAEFTALLESSYGTVSPRPELLRR